MSEIPIQTARLYASRNHLRLAERLGFGIHGIAYVVEDNFKPGKTAILCSPRDARQPTLTRPAGTLSHRMGEGWGEGKRVA